MTAGRGVKRIIRLGLLVAWLGVHVLAIAITERWWFTFWLVLSGPLYIGTVHWFDRYFHLGGVGSSVRVLRLQLEQEKNANGARDWSAAANQTVPITTGFAAILLFNSVRFYHDLSLDPSSDFQSKTVLIVASVAFCVACVLNLIQILILRLFTRHERIDGFNKRLRRMLRFFSGLAWHSLLTPVILLLMLLDWPVLVLLVNVSYGTCLYVYYFTAIPKVADREETQPEPQ